MNPNTKFIETPCGHEVPDDRICFGNKNVELELCQECEIFMEKKKSPFFTPKPRVISKKNVIIKMIPCGISVEARY